MKSDPRYTSTSIFNTFPWPQSPTASQIMAVATAGQAILALRATTVPTLKGGLRELYRTVDLPGKNPLKDAHAALDAAVLKAYGFDATTDLLSQLLALNESVAGRIEADEQVTAPGIPANYLSPATLVTSDCLS